MAKAKLRELIFVQAAMSGVRDMTYAIMSNHLHLLLAVNQPENNRAQLDDEAIPGRLGYVTREEPLMKTPYRRRRHGGPPYGALLIDLGTPRLE